MRRSAKAGAAEALKPWYRQFCKRPTFNDDFLATFNRDNVHLVDVSASKGVDGITEKGVMANGEEIELDCLIFATGFEITTSAHRRVDFDTRGRNGQSLYDHWGEGFRTLHGLSSHGFPNWFTIGINQNGLSPNMTAMFDDQAVHVSYIIDEVQKRRHHHRSGRRGGEGLGGGDCAPRRGRQCGVPRGLHPGLLQPGRAGGKGVSMQNSPYAPGINAFNDLLARWREAGTLEGMTLSAEQNA